MGENKTYLSANRVKLQNKKVNVHAQVGGSQMSKKRKSHSLHLFFPLKRVQKKKPVLIQAKKPKKSATLQISNLRQFSVISSKASGYFIFDDISNFPRLLPMDDLESPNLEKSGKIQVFQRQKPEFHIYFYIIQIGKYTKRQKSHKSTLKNLILQLVSFLLYYNKSQFQYINLLQHDRLNSFHKFVNS